jgi:hypothetical protein
MMSHAASPVGPCFCTAALRSIVEADKVPRFHRPPNISRLTGMAGSAVSSGLRDWNIKSQRIISLGLAVIRLL